MLSEAGVDLAQPNPLKVWRIFQQFANVPVDTPNDMFLFQCGVYDWTGKPMFHFDFLRQFDVDSVDEDGEPQYDHMEQLHCTFFYEPVAELVTLNTHLWADQQAPVKTFFAAVEALPAFVIPTTRFSPVSVSIYQHPV
jgi:hypothetical protein